MSHFWHPFADMAAVRDGELVLRSANGVWVEDVDGRRYLDATGGLWYCSVGYGRRAIAAAVADQLERFAAYSAFGPFVTDVTLRAADRLAALAPIEDAVVFFTSGGSDAVETVSKLARRYWDACGHPERRVIVARERAYHGMHAYGTALAGIPANQAGYGGALIEEVVVVPTNDPETLGALFQSRGHEIAAFIGEPVIGAGGVIPPEPYYWPEVSRLCREYDILLIADEVISGFGRLGEMWGTTRYGITPDLVTFAKGVTSGYVPLGGVLVGKRVREPFWDRGPGGPVFRHGYTYSGHAAACAAALANLDILETEGLVARVKSLEPKLAALGLELAAVPGVGQVRTVGLTAAVELAPEVLAATPTAADAVAKAARAHGILTRSLTGGAIQVSPAFVITESELEQLADGIRAAIRDTVEV
ncbi:MAG TPA: aminotransferase class III-fold pyridoxal phosphate-dependent enzyme [Candidatus Sulfotelmatobacter sp.]|nr:aminotransferase class III-fold pyridoxal phosphate-dependent enzyme [Candidatus Sulfotelmatobacter sp.]